MTFKTVLLASVVALTPLAAKAGWKEHVEIDRMTGKPYAAMRSPMVLADKPRPSPFDVIRGGLVVWCGFGTVDFFLGTDEGTGGPVFTKIKFSDLDELPIRAKADDRIFWLRVENSRSGSGNWLTAYGTESGGLYSAILNSGKLLLEVPTTEYGNLYFSFGLAGTRALHDRVCAADQAD